MMGMMEQRTVTVSGKITPSAKKALDDIAASMPFAPSTSKLVETAVDDLIKKYAKKPKRQKSSGVTSEGEAG